VINKIDLPSAEPRAVQKQLEDILAIPAEEAILASAKMGIGIEDILEAVVPACRPAPADNRRCAAWCFDSVFDTYRGVVSYVRVFSGRSRRAHRSDDEHRQDRGQGGRRLHPEDGPRATLASRRCGLHHRQHQVVRRGQDRRHHHRRGRIPPPRRCPASRRSSPMVFSGIYPVEHDDYEQLKLAWASSRSTTPPSPTGRKLRRAGLRLPLRLPRPAAHGDRAGAPAPRVRHGRHLDLPGRGLPGARLNDGERIEVDNPSFLPEPQDREIREPTSRLHHGAQRQHRRHDAAGHGEARRTRPHRDARRRPRDAHLRAAAQRDPGRFQRPLKSITRGYGSMDYEHGGYRRPRPGEAWTS
jgi:GTP-binding protein LepA